MLCNLCTEKLIVAGIQWCELPVIKQHHSKNRGRKAALEETTYPLSHKPAVDAVMLRTLQCHEIVVCQSQPKLCSNQVEQQDFSSTRSWC